MYRIAGLLTLPIRPGQTGLTTDSQHEPAIRLRFGTAALIPERAGAACFLSFQNCQKRFYIRMGHIQKDLQSLLHGRMS